MSIEGQGHFFTIYFFPVFVCSCFTRPRCQVSVYRTVGPLVVVVVVVLLLFFFQFCLLIFSLNLSNVICFLTLSAFLHICHLLMLCRKIAIS